MNTKALSPEPIIKLIELSGRFDAHVAPEFIKWTDENIPASQEYLLVDLKKVNFIDSTALASLVRGMKHCREKGGDLALCNLQQPVQIIFELTRMDQAFRIYTTQEDAFEKARAEYIEKLL
ncbi:MAG: STAS domain-containing protein [Chloroflexi bacterium]|nr:STAS domain-containing protein [Chloroflexota bacterium]